METMKVMTVLGALMMMGGSASAAGPTAKEILQNDVVKQGMERAWKESFLGGGVYQSRGGWIYADASNPLSDMLVVLGSKSRSKPFSSPSSGANIDVDMEMELDKPEREGVPSAKGKKYVLVADFHTHPTDNRPDSSDISRAYQRGVPAFLISCSGIFSYGPSTRPSLDDGYLTYPPSASPPLSSVSETRLSDNFLDASAKLCA
eukprot:TRINITY_DN112_c0_g1_i1.p1 TRINITY_DN112_c0_g1~~TRINITY_DN112_c0_g1_i1.p1  ORF type:complete len:204 (-),score=17.98 TRINITY_DN112_c0_g1_i1:246-857(-)